MLITLHVYTSVASTATRDTTYSQVHMETNTKYKYGMEQKHGIETEILV